MEKAVMLSLTSQTINKKAKVSVGTYFWKDGQQKSGKLLSRHTIIYFNPEGQVRGGSLP
jgi:hypothetical protein